jgi:UDP-2,3-diacylglucosamine pyrophosphatase LpxH
MQSGDFDTVILSDLHLGAEMSRAGEALQLLKSVSFRRLILLGDIFSDLNFRRLKKQHWQFLSYIRKVSNPKRKVEVVWVEGNHDRGLSQLMSHLVGVPVYGQYGWDYDGLRHLAIHGHQFDRFSAGESALCRWGEELFQYLQKLDPREMRVSRFLDRMNSRCLRLRAKVQNGALNYARQRGAQRIFCGHTHIADHARAGEIDYFNTGSWVDLPCSFIGINTHGVAIYEIDPRTDDRDPGQKREALIAAPAGFDCVPRLLPAGGYQGAGC